ncbi:TIGR02099 family protein [Chitinibacter bivalviorum]|uniref:TIGR02099 family protein n=1 Tax=Chitinibacter bivalviorum TaxID=2739434 RepID=A0A7H9BF29_9NEIS|nr:YhdP family protein [Chitinibacter bivalviorum]QLG87177.1 TIGR02099 family protein [Chitinibacter bivalviorum]
MSLAFLRQLKSLTARVTDWHLRWLKRAFFTCVLLLALCALTWQFWLLPRLNDYKPWLEQEISTKVGAPVQIASIDGGWRGIRPSLALHQFQMLDQHQRSVLEFDRMEGDLSWWNLLIGQVRFSHLLLQSPQLDMKRLADGRWQIAGMTLAAEGHSDNQLLNWLLSQGELTIAQGRLQLNDLRGEFPTLSANDLQLNVSNWLGTHQLNLQFTPPQLSGKVVQLSARLKGDDVNLWSQWSGWVKLNLPQADLKQVAPWLTAMLPDFKMLSGLGALGLKLELDEGVLQGVEADVTLKDWRLKLAEQPELVLPLFDGRVVWRDIQKKRSLQLNAKQIVGATGLLCRLCDLEYTQTKSGQTLDLRNWYLEGLNGYLAYLPEPLRQYRQAHLQGVVNQLSFEWQGGWPFKAQAAMPELGAIKGEAKLSQLAWRQVADLPSVSGINVDLQFAPKGVRLALEGENVDFDYPAQFLEPLKFGLLQTKLDWVRDGKTWTLNLDAFKLANAEMSLTAQGNYVWPGKGAGQVDLKADIERLATSRVYAYLPRVLTDEVLIWLKTSLLAGEARKGQLIWRGDVAQFPYTKNTDAAKAGQFTIVTQGAGVTINYGEGWPNITEIDGLVTIDGMALTVDAKKGNITGTSLRDVKVTIPNLEHDQHVLVTGQVKGRTSDFLKYVETSPVRTATHGFLDTLTAQGEGQLDLKLDIPVADIEKTKINGTYAFSANRLNFGGAIPVLDSAKGVVSFTESTMKVQPSHAKALGGSVTLQGETDASGALALKLAGQADLAPTLKHYFSPLSPWLQGIVPFQALLQVSEDKYDLALSSDLVGGVSQLPAPLDKVATTSRAFQLKVSGSNDSQPRIDFAYDKLLQGAIQLNQNPQLTRGKIVLGSESSASSTPKLGAINLDAKGVALTGFWPQLNVNDWLPLKDSALTGADHVAGSTKNAPPILLQNLGFERVTLWGRQLNDVRLGGQITEHGAQFNLSSQQIAGELQWQSQPSQIKAQLSKLWLPLKLTKPESPAIEKLTPSLLNSREAALLKNAAMSAETPDELMQLPALNLLVNDLRYKDVELGVLKVVSKPQGTQGMLFDELSMTNPDGALMLSGAWSKVDGTQRTQGKIKIDSPNMGKLLKRFGYPEAMKGAPLKLSGEGQWQGEPWAPKWPSLQGKINLDVGAGQFMKLDPGVGRFLSILSLQALPRRLKLDFSDVFSDGFEFDAIRGDALIEQGIAKTNNLQINGPAAKINFTGDANFIASTQHLRVRIVPSISGAVALGVTVVNPLAGLATLAVQSVMDNPLGELVAYEFQIDGSMSDPQIKKIGIRPEGIRRN